MKLEIGQVWVARDGLHLLITSVDPTRFKWESSSEDRSWAGDALGLLSALKSLKYKLDETHTVKSIIAKYDHNSKES